MMDVSFDVSLWWLLGGGACLAFVFMQNDIVQSHPLVQRTLDNVRGSVLHLASVLLTKGQGDSLNTLNSLKTQAAKDDGSERVVHENAPNASNASSEDLPMIEALPTALSTDLPADFVQQKGNNSNVMIEQVSVLYEKRQRQEEADRHQKLEAEWSAERQRLNAEVQHLHVEAKSESLARHQLDMKNERLVVENERLKHENERLKHENERLKLENDQLVAKNDQLVAENNHLKLENNQLVSTNSATQRDYNQFKMDTKIGESETVAELATLKQTLQTIEFQHQTAIQRAILEESQKSQARIAELAEEKGSKATLVKEHDQLKLSLVRAIETQEEWKQKHAAALLAADRSNNPQTVHPAFQGNQGEQETEEMLRRALGSLFYVENVSKIGQGREMDLKLTSRDRSMTIRIDCKNYESALLPEKEIVRFNKDLDEMKPAADACILFSKPPVKGSDLFHKTKRGAVWRYHVGCWAFPILLECIHDAIVMVKLQREHDARENPGNEQRIAGAEEIGTVFTKMLMLMNMNQKEMAMLAEHSRLATNKTAVHQRDISKALQMAHSLQPTIITQAMLVQYESQIPKQARGRPPKIKALEPTLLKETTETETIGSKEPNDTKMDAKHTKETADPVPAKERRVQKRRKPTTESKAKPKEIDNEVEILDVKTTAAASSLAAASANNVQDMDQDADMEDEPQLKKKIKELGKFAFAGSAAGGRANDAN